MPVIIRTQGGGGKGGVTLDDCTNISATSKSDGIEIKWTDPQDVVFGGKTTAQWKGTKLVRKEGSYPTSEKDGVLVKDSTVRNEHSTVAFKDTGVTADVVYYYCLFPYTDKAVTMSDNNRFTGKRISFSFDSVLKNNTWSQIAQASEQGIASQLWQIGDEIKFKLAGEYNETVTAQIWDFNHFDKSDSSGKAGICFGIKYPLMLAKKMNLTNNNLSGWHRSNMRTITMNDIYSNCIPYDLRSVIKKVRTEDNEGSGSTSSIVSDDTVFLPGIVELGFNDQYYGNQKRFPIFSDNSSRMKGSVYWTRSANRIVNMGGTDFECITVSGTRYNNPSDSDLGVCFCFNV